MTASHKGTLKDPTYRVWRKALIIGCLCFVGAALLASLWSPGDEVKDDSDICAETESC